MKGRFTNKKHQGKRTSEQENTMHLCICWFLPQWLQCNWVKFHPGVPRGCRSANTQAVLTESRKISTAVSISITGKRSFGTFIAQRSFYPHSIYTDMLCVGVSLICFFFCFIRKETCSMYSSVRHLLFNNFESHPYCCTYKQLLYNVKSFFILWECLSLSLGGHWSGFHIFATVNKTTMNAHVQVILWIYIFISLEQVTKTGISSSNGCYRFNFLKSYFFLQVCAWCHSDHLHMKISLAAKWFFSW